MISQPLKPLPPPVQGSEPERHKHGGGGGYILDPPGDATAAALKGTYKRGQGLESENESALQGEGGRWPDVSG